jgi:hypothetical protein
MPRRQISDDEECRPDTEALQDVEDLGRERWRRAVVEGKGYRRGELSVSFGDELRLQDLAETSPRVTIWTPGAVARKN